ncbi:hypothetical protein LCGC14_1992150, partial [marine sediment metagenome]
MTQNPPKRKLPIRRTSLPKVRPLKSNTEGRMARYRNGGEGFILWCEENVHIPIYPEGSDIVRYISMSDLGDAKHPETGRSYNHIWNEQKEICREALRMVNGRFVHTLIVLCWMRGEGKSLLACLIQLWKFYCWPKQQIMLGANSKDQVKFVHYDIMRDIIINSPKLLKIIGRRNIQEKEIRLKDKNGNVRSIIRSISSFSGIVSNITGYTFSEIFDMKNPKFFVQLDGSIRNIPNAIGVIDSTVSAKTHILYSLYSNHIQKKTPTLFFSYRSSKNGDHRDYWNPNMTQVQLEAYEAKFPFGEYERYFLNLWSAGQAQVFTDEMIEEISYMGVDGEILNHKQIQKVIEEKNRLIEVLSKVMEKGFPDGIQETEEKITHIDNRITPVSSFYVLGNKYNIPVLCDMDKLAALGDLLETDWLVSGGADMG